MQIIHKPGSIKKFRRMPWRFQQTFVTPLKSLPPFVAEVCRAVEPLESATLTLEQIVFEPKHLAEYCQPLGSSDWQLDTSFEATGEAEVAALLEAALSDWLDFAFVPVPKRFAIYADHDEYATFFAMTKSHLNRVVKGLLNGGFRAVDNYARKLL